ncbi:MAG: hypothetical protein HQ538_02565 [Parcubacteria group bacterium]|nr:hypothetical protein [Parcubacteria group bacterium]
MSKLVSVLFCLNDRKFIKEQLDMLVGYTDELIILMGNMPFTEFFTSPEGNSMDGTKEFIENYIEEKGLKDKITFIHSLHYAKGFDTMKPLGFKLAQERNPDYIQEFCCNEFYLKKDLVELRRKMDANELPEMCAFDFRHFYKLLRWSFIMGVESRIFRNRPGRFMPNQSYLNEADGKNVASIKIPGLAVNHFCPCKPIRSYIDKYMCYHMRGRVAKKPEKQDFDWAIKVLTDEGYILPDDMVQQEIDRVGGAWMATEFLGPWPEVIYNHPNFKREVTDYYTGRGYKFENGEFIK